MNDPAWSKVVQLCRDYPAEFNAAAAYDVVKAAWRMGFDVVRAPAGSDLYGRYGRAVGEAMSNAAGTSAGLQNTPCVQSQ